MSRNADAVPYYPSVWWVLLVGIYGRCSMEVKYSPHEDWTSYPFMWMWEFLCLIMCGVLYFTIVMRGAILNNLSIVCFQVLVAATQAMNEELPRLQEGVYYGHINQRTDILDKFLTEDGEPRYNPQVWSTAGCGTCCGRLLNGLSCTTWLLCSI